MLSKPWKHFNIGIVVKIDRIEYLFREITFVISYLLHPSI